MAVERHRSEYMISIIRQDGGPVYLTPGGTAERKLVKEIVAEINKSYTGVLITHARVLELVEDAVNDVLLRVKSDIIPRRPPVA